MTSPDARPSDRYPAGSAAFPHRDLTGLAGLTPWEPLILLDEDEEWVTLGRSSHKRDVRLGADVVNMQVAQSSVKKGETLIDTAMTLNAMHADAIVIRHPIRQSPLETPRAYA